MNLLSPLFGAAVTLIAGVAYAQSVQLQLFEPAVGSNNFFVTHSGELIAPSSFEIGLQLSGAQDLLAVVGSNGESEDLVDTRADAYLLAAARPFSFLEFGARLSAASTDTPSDAALNAFALGDDDVSSFSLGELHLEPKLRVLDLDDGALAVALIPTVVVPIDDSALSNENSTMLHPKLAVSHRRRALHTALNVGVRLRERSVIGTLVQDDELTLRGAVALALLQGKSTLRGVIDVFAHLPLNDSDLELETVDEDDVDSLRRTGEVAAGIQWLTGDWSLKAAFGVGLNDGYGAPSARLIASVGYRFLHPPPQREITPPAPVVEDGDGDGVPDEQDRCPDQAGPNDDGCPIADQDGDGIPDSRDACPDRPEDRNNQEDDDGCPDADRDLDGIVDTVDQCPDDLEDVDGFADDDGCPDLDNDGDGILDAFDRCPTEAEDFDGRRDKDGCPE